MKVLTLRLDDKTYETFLRASKAENRSLANFIETATKAYIRETAFVDDAEFAAILANERLIERLKKGARDAEQRRGHRVTSLPNL